MEFKVGDIVKICSYIYCNGRIGVIESIDNNKMYPFKVNFGGNNTFNYIWFRKDELLVIDSESTPYEV